MITQLAAAPPERTKRASPNRWDQLTHARMNRGGPRGGFIPAEILVQHGTGGGNGTGGGTLHIQPY